MPYTEDDAPAWKVIGVTIAVILMCAAVGFALLLMSRAARAQQLPPEVELLFERSARMWQACPNGADCRPMRTEDDSGQLLQWTAGSADKWGHDPSTSEWFRNLRSPRGFPCCDYADGTRIEDPDYQENDDGSYDVRARGQIAHIPPDKVVQGMNRVGYAILWWGAGPEPYCFLPGSRS